MGKKGILILSHVGYSFVDKIINELNKLGLESYILSSKFIKEDEERVRYLEKSSNKLFITHINELSYGDIDKTISSLQNSGIKVKACISVWEGYRGLMAYANNSLGVFDISEKIVDLVTNKYNLRKILYDNNLSKVKANLLNIKEFEKHKNLSHKKFIKPIKGIGSSGTFLLTKDTSWLDVVNLKKNLLLDPVYKSIFKENFPLMIEDYIPGIECSFEIIVNQNKSYILAVHEKNDVSFKKNTTLENSCISPPVSLDADQIQQSYVWLDRVLSLLKIETGCYHIEAKYNNDYWELIEINPRLGGSLISDSVQYLTGGYSLINLWLQLLLSNNKETIITSLLREISINYRSKSSVLNELATFFRVYYGEKGTIKSINKKDNIIKPVIENLFVSPGSIFNSEDKENFVGQALWFINNNLIEESNKIKEASENYITVDYEKDLEKSFLIVDYNLSRIKDVEAIANYVRTKYFLKIVLIKANPNKLDYDVADYVLDLDPRTPDFHNLALKLINKFPIEILSGIVFSDNAVHTGAKLLESLNINVDNSDLAKNAYCKYEYRMQELSIKKFLNAQNIFVPNLKKIKDLKDLEDFIYHDVDSSGIVIKPCKEGNNRGVILLTEPKHVNLNEVLQEVSEYIADGVIVEEMIPFQREFSYDGVSNFSFITQKFNCTGKYPVEYAQLIPANITESDEALIIKTGSIANLIVGQNKGPFHNEIRIDNNGEYAAVVEANRRPAGMHIWTLAEQVFEKNIYALWVDSVLDRNTIPAQKIRPTRSALSLMLGLQKSNFSDRYVCNFSDLLNDLRRKIEIDYPDFNKYLTWLKFELIVKEGDYINVPPKTNSDFIAIIILTADMSSYELSKYIYKIQLCWSEVITKFDKSMVST